MTTKTEVKKVSKYEALNPTSAEQADKILSAWKKCAGYLSWPNVVAHPKSAEVVADFQGRAVVWIGDDGTATFLWPIGEKSVVNFSSVRDALLWVLDVIAVPAKYGFDNSTLIIEGSRHLDTAADVPLAAKTPFI